jgi:hypothetical protein
MKIRTIILALTVVVGGCALNVTPVTRSFELSQIIRAKVEMQLLTDASESKVATGDSHKKYFPRLVAFLEENGVQTFAMSDEFKAAAGPGQQLLGYYIKEKKSILINTDVAPNLQLATLLHEFGHHIQPMETGDMSGQVFAEAISFFVCEAIGLDVSEASQGYMSKFEYDLILIKYSKHIDIAVATILKGIQ